MPQLCPTWLMLQLCPTWLMPQLCALPATGCPAAVKKKESKLYGAHFKDVDHSQKATKISFDSDDE